ncbi:MAG: hypothetical protein Q7S57_02000 [bacterium]|nr:hypothetical protein [bacterium]
MQGKIIIYGAKSLERYTKNILKNGFINYGWQTEEGAVGDGKNLGLDIVLYQIHGAPQAAEDEAIMAMIKAAPAEQKAIVLVHRPDEVQTRLPGVVELLSGLSPNKALAFLGNLHQNDSFYCGIKNRFVVPHGFFDMKDTIQTEPIIIGTHTTWGEMRSVEHMIKLLAEVFKLDPNNARNIWGYLGGKPKEQLQIDGLKKITADNFGALAVNFVDINKNSARETLQGAANGEHTILVDSENIEPADFGMTFNVQMYYLGNAIRTGESSGSLHMSVGVPVILEMNGSEVIEDLNIIRVPYQSLADINSVDFAAGAQKIISAVDGGGYVNMLQHNLGQARKFNNTFVAQSYVKIFEQL